MPGKPYNTEEITHVLTQVALQQGNVYAAERSLNAQVAEGNLDRSPEHETIYRWLSLYQDEYREIVARELPRIREAVAADNISLAQRYAEAEGEFLEKMLEKKEDFEPKELANAVRNLATSKGIAVDKVERVTEHASPAVSLPQLGEVLGGLLKAAPELFNQPLIEAPPEKPHIDVEVIEEAA